MPMKQISVKNRELQTIQQNAANAIAAMGISSVINNTTSSAQSIQTPFSGGHLISHVSLTTGQDNLIPHKLGKMPQVWIMTDNNAASYVWSPGSSALSGASSNQTYLNLQSSANTTVSIWVA